MKSINIEGVVVPAIEDVSFSKDALIVDLSDGRVLQVPLAWYPKLAGAKASQLKAFEISPAGYGIHWPKLDEDLSVAGFLFPGGIPHSLAKAA